MIRILKAVQTALNLIPRTPLSIHGFADTYELASAVDSVVGGFPPIPRDYNKFCAGSIVNHHNDLAACYRILLTPREGLMLEGTVEPAYAYTRTNGDDRRIWVRSASQFDDGRFNLVKEAVAGNVWPKP